MHMQMIWHIQSLDSETESEEAVRYYVGHECRAYDCAVYRKVSNGFFFFFNSVSSKRRLSRLTRGCADIDIYSVAWVLSWIRICQQHIGRNNCSRSKWRGRLCNYILHEFFADRTYLLGQRGTEHHDLLAVRCASEYFLYVPAHICNSNAAQLIIYQLKWDVKSRINLKNRSVDCG